MALLLAVVLCLGLLTGCKQDSGETDDPVESQEPVESQNPEGVALDPDAAYAKHDPDDVVMTINGTDVTWSEFFYNLYTVVYPIQYYSDNNVVWSGSNLYDASVTNEVYAWENALNTCIQYHVLEQNIADMGITLNAEDEAAIQDTLQADMASFCGEDATEETFNDFLGQIYLTRDTYDFMNRVAQLYDHSYDEKFGRNGEMLSEEDIQNFVEHNEYVTVKHILIKTKNDDGTDMTEDEVAEKTARATLLLTQLQEVADDRDALVKKFDELMQENTEDAGVNYYPDGYTFRPGEMVEEFETAAKALENYGLSDLVKSDYGYHIILRLPTTRDSVVTYVDPVTSYTVGAYAAAEAYGKLLDSWVNDAQVQWSKDFENMTVEKIFS